MPRLQRRVAFYAMQFLNALTDKNSALNNVGLMLRSPLRC